MNETGFEAEIVAGIGTGAGTEVENGTGAAKEIVDANHVLQKAELGVVVLHAKGAGGKEGDRGQRLEMQDEKSTFLFSINLEIFCHFSFF